MCGLKWPSITVNVEIFTQYIFSRMVSYARKCDVSENLNHYRLDGIMYKMCKNMSTRKLRKGHIGLDARKISCVKISTFTVIMYPPNMSEVGPLEISVRGRS